MQVYLDMAQSILDYGFDTGDRTGVGTRAKPGHAYEIRLSADDNGVIHNFPLLTTKKVFLRGSFEELKWKLAGNTNILDLITKKVHIWTEWPFKRWLEATGEIGKFEWFIDDKKSDYTDDWKNRIATFEQMVIEDEASKHWGELGPTYGHQMRGFGEITKRNFDATIPWDMEQETVLPGFDQLADVIYKILFNPTDRRVIMSLWNPIDNKSSLLPPCPCFYQFFANQEGYLHLNVYQRSCDTFLGVPFNDSQDSLLLISLAYVTGRKPRFFNHFFGDVHIYNNHRDQIEEQLSRKPRQLPSIYIEDDHKRPIDLIDPKDITDESERRQFVNDCIKYLINIEWERIKIIDYNPYPVIKAPVAV